MFSEIPNQEHGADVTCRLRAAATKQPRPATPKHVFTKSIATIMAIFRESFYPQLTPLRSAFWIKVPSLGTIFILMAYLAFILALEFVNNDVPGAQHNAALATRAAWLAIAQLPLVILLAGKNNLIGLLTGVSHERLNIFHRWVARGMLLLATLHICFQDYGWNLYGLRHLEWSTDICAPTGIAAYTLLLWINLSTVAPFRHLFYEFFVIQHLLTFFGLIIAIMIHLPSTALYSRVYIYIPIALYLIDRIIRSVRWGANNFRPGRATLFAVGDGDVTRIRIQNPQIKKWTPGAFVLLSIPRFGFAQSHPATIASIPASHDGDLVFILKSHGGFTKRILDSGSSLPLSQTTNEKPEPKTYRAFIDGPYGASHANFAAFDTVVLIAGSTGISFILPLLLDIAHRAGELRQKLPVRRVQVVWMAKSSSCMGWVAEELQGVFKKLHRVGIEITIKMHATCDERLTDAEDASRGKEEECQSIDSDGEIETEKPAPAQGKDQSEKDSKKDSSPTTRTRTRTTTTITEKRPRERKLDCVTMLSGRPDLHTLLWDVLDDADGETGVAVCGPLGLCTAVRAAVVSISDRLAVRKETGAQGTYLHVEEFSL
jgi:ferric-chelate reductase